MPYLTPINNMFQLSGIYLIMAVSIDRLVIVRKQVKPTIGNRRRRKLLTWLVIMAIFLFSFLFTLPNWFLYESERIELNIFDRDLDFARFESFILMFVDESDLIIQAVNIYDLLPIVKIEVNDGKFRLFYYSFIHRD